MDNDILIVAPDSRLLSNFVRKMGGEPFSWTYLGSRIDESRLTEGCLNASGSNVDASAGFHEAADRLREPYLLYIYDIGRRLKSLRWWLTSLSYRSAYMSKTFQQACYLRAALDLMDGWQGPGPLVIVAGDPPLRRALQQNSAGVPGRRVNMVGRTGWLPFQSLRDTLNMLAHKAFFLYREGRRVIWARRLIPRSNAALQNTTLLISTVHSRNVGDRGDFHRFVFGDLAAHLDDLGHKVAAMPVILRDTDYKRALTGLRDSRLPLAVPHVYLNIRDLLWAVASTLRKPPIPDPIPSFSGMNISALIQAEHRTHWIRNQAADALLMVALVQRWASVGANVARVIYLYENQPWERALCWQMRRSMPDAKIVGYQFGRAPRLLLNWHLAPGEKKEAPLPDRVVTGGEYGARQLRSACDRSAWIKVGGTLQMRNLSALRSQASKTPAPTNPISVLVTPSYGLEESAELVDIAGRLFDENENILVVVKCHPLMPFDRVASLLSQPLPGHVEVSDEPTTDLMRKSSVILYTSSTICVEALAAGLPAIHLRSRFELNTDPLESAPDARLEALGLEDLREKIRWLLSNRTEYICQHRARWDQLADDIYGPVTDETYRAFVD